MTKTMARDTKVAMDTKVAREMMTRNIRATKVMRKTKGLNSGEGDDDDGESRDPYGGPLTTTVYSIIVINIRSISGL